MKDVLCLGLKWLSILKLWPLTLKFDRATGLFLEFDMRYGVYRYYETKYYLHDIGHSLNSTCDIKPLKRKKNNDACMTWTISLKSTWT